MAVKVKKYFFINLSVNIQPLFVNQKNHQTLFIFFLLLPEFQIFEDLYMKRLAKKFFMQNLDLLTVRMLFILVKPPSLGEAKLHHSVNVPLWLKY